MPPKIVQNLLKTSSHRPASYSQNDHLIGVRGILTIQTFLWTFLSLFVPAAVKVADSETQSPGPAYAVLLRKTLSVLLWNGPLIYSSIIFLSARIVCLPFLASPTSHEVGGAAFRRGVRLFIPSAVALGFASLGLARVGYDKIGEFLESTHNTNVQVPYRLPNFLAYFNAVFDLFWVNKNVASQAGSRAFPGQNLWVVTTVFMQSFTVYMTMCVIPYTRNSWRVKAFLVFILTAWWVQSWAWYSITALLIADVVAHMDFRARAMRGLKLFGGKSRFRLPAWILYGVMMVAGIVMQYLWTAWRPEYENMENKGHTGLYNAQPLNNGFDYTQPMARDDNYLIVLGFFLMLETYEGFRNVFRFPLFVYLGRRSFSKSISPSPALLYFISYFILHCPRLRRALLM
jgi:hypothetical protein